MQPQSRRGAEAQRQTQRRFSFKEFPLCVFLCASAVAFHSFRSHCAAKTASLHFRPMIEKIFKAYDVRATYPNPLNEDAAWKVGHATAQFLKRSRQQNPEPKVALNDTIVIGR